jgi:hypothetical protein
MTVDLRRVLTIMIVALSIGGICVLPPSTSLSSFDYSLVIQNERIMLIPGENDSTLLFVNQSGNRTGTVNIQGTWGEHTPEGLSVAIEPESGIPPFTSSIVFHSTLDTYPGIYLYEITVDSDGTNQTSIIQVNVTTNLNVRVSTDKDAYQKGQSIRIYGNATTSQNVVVSTGNAYIFLQTPKRTIRLSSPIQNNTFDGLYQISYGDDEGPWNVLVRIVDNQKQVGIQTKNISVSLPPDIMRFNVGFYSPPNTAVYQRGDSFKISVYVTEDLQSVQNATTTCILPSFETIPLLEYTPGDYIVNYVIPWDAPVGESFFTVQSIKNMSGELKAGGSALSIFIEPAPLQIIVLEPSAIQFSPDSVIPLQVEVRYLDSSIVATATVIAQTPNGNITLQKEKNGLYTANISISPQNIGNQVIDIEASDLYGNVGTAKKIVLIASDVQTPIANTIIPLVIAGICGFFGVFYIRRYYRFNRLKTIREEMVETQRLQQEAAKKYYKEGVISKQVFEALMYEHAQRYAHLQKEERKIIRK